MTGLAHYCLRIYFIFHGIPLLSGSALTKKDREAEEYKMTDREIQERTSMMDRHWNFWKKNLALPFISNETKSTVLGTIGRTTYLNCIVGNIGDREVSWLRTRDLRILSIGKVRYTEDPRFEPLHAEGNDVWALKIRNASMKDEGIYECQVSYHGDQEKKLKWPVRLRILDSRAVIAGNPERHVKAGSLLRLRCFIEFSSGTPSFIYWYRNDIVMNYSERPGVRIQTFSSSSENGRRKSSAPASILRIDRVLPEDAGNYTCSPSNARNHSVQVHVVKVHLAMQRETGSDVSSIQPSKSEVQPSPSSSSRTYTTRGFALFLLLGTIFKIRFLD